jgi:hypothetical protein
MKILISSEMILTYVHVCICYGWKNHDLIDIFVIQLCELAVTVWALRPIIQLMEGVFPGAAFFDLNYWGRPQPPGLSARGLAI